MQLRGGERGRGEGLRCRMEGSEGRRRRRRRRRLLFLLLLPRITYRGKERGGLSHGRRKGRRKKCFEANKVGSSSSSFLVRCCAVQRRKGPPAEKIEMALHMLPPLPPPFWPKKKRTKKGSPSLLVFVSFLYWQIAPGSKYPLFSLPCSRIGLAGFPPPRRRGPRRSWEEDG